MQEGCYDNSGASGEMIWRFYGGKCEVRNWGCERFLNEKELS